MHRSVFTCFLLKSACGMRNQLQIVWWLLYIWIGMHLNNFLWGKLLKYGYKIFITIMLVRLKKARFDSKMHGSTQKSPVRHKDARFDTKMPSPARPSWYCHHQPPPPPPTPVRNNFFQFYSNILFWRTDREMKMKLYWYEFKINIQYHYENWDVIILFCLWWP